MPLLLNLRQLEKGPRRLEGGLTPAELELENVDELIRLESPVAYNLEASKLDQNILVQGALDVLLRCECARCLKPFDLPLKLHDWTCLLELEGEESEPVMNDCVDLTPHVREDILLELPQHPLCQAGCRGLPKKSTGKNKTTGGSGK